MMVTVFEAMSKHTWSDECGSPSPIVQPADGVESADSCVPDFQMTSVENNEQVGVENNEQVGRGEPKFRKLHFL
jgi:hypothetical protein